MAAPVAAVAPAAKLDLPRLAAMHPFGLARMCRLEGRPLHLWPHQRQVIRAILEHRWTLNLKARQLGFTWAYAVIALWWAIARPGSTILIVSIGEREAKDVLRRLRLLYVSLPDEVRAAFPLGADSATRLEIVHDDGRVSAVLSLPSSSNAGRGQTVDLLIGDERPKWPDPDAQLAALMPAAADRGHVVMGGTANGFDSFYDLWDGAPANGWHPVFAAADARPDRTQEWIRQQRDMLGDLGAQEYPMSPEEAFLSSGRCVFNLRDLEDLLEHSCVPARWRGRLERTHGQVRPFADEHGAWQVWAWPEEGRDYVIAADACGGTGAGDYAACVVVDALSWEQVAAYHARVDPTTLARELVTAGWVWRTALLVPEANNHGQGVTALLREWGYPNVYETERFDSRRPAVERRLGWETTAKTRPLALAALKAAIADGELPIRDRDAVREFRTFIVTDTGREEADRGAHDDRVMAWAIACAVLGRSRRVEPAAAVGDDELVYRLPLNVDGGY